MAKIILISPYALPFSEIGSWTEIYNRYLQSDHLITYIVCEEPVARATGITYGIVKNSSFISIRKKIHYYRINYIDALEKLIKPGEKYVIQIMDNFQIGIRVEAFLTRKNLRKNCYIQLCYHGFTPFLSGKAAGFYSRIDEMLMLTHESYRAHLKHYGVFTCRVSVLHNGIDTSRFKPVPADKKTVLKQEAGYKDKIVFVWCSQDRKKKGLDLLLDAWRVFHKKHQNTVLLVVGAKRSTNDSGVVFYGNIENKYLPEIFQMSDCYLFPTLCHEGFGLSLIEALNCGSYCIASALGGVPEVLQYGKLGQLIQNPNYISEWVAAMEDFVAVPKKTSLPENGIYTMQEWNLGMNKIISQAAAIIDSK